LSGLLIPLDFQSEADFSKFRNMPNWIWHKLFTVRPIPSGSSVLCCNPGYWDTEAPYSAYWPRAI